MATQSQDDLQRAVELALDPLRESIFFVGQTADALRTAIENAELGQLEKQTKDVEAAVARCKALLDTRMESFEKRLFSGIERRLREPREGGGV